MTMSGWVALAAALIAGAGDTPPRQVSGIYPHLATFNDEQECGTGAVVPFADRLWIISYGPHLPYGSSDKLYEITPDLEQIIRPESIGGTCANRLIHRESNQLFIGPYVIGADRSVRAIPFAQMPGRHTATIRHLLDPAGKVYYATMEEGLYEVDVDTLEVRGFYRDENVARSETGPGSLPDAGLPGYHGKGAWSSQGVLVYSNNGEQSPLARSRPDIPSGSLAEWDGESWTVIRRNQFCEVTGPGDLYGNTDPDAPIWATGWDHRSLLLMVRADGAWHTYRLPKSSHSYDGAHGWNTEWPRIREVGEDDLLMTMHGAFWRFPADFGPGRARGIRPRSNYLKIIGDFARWGDRLVFGCDDAARSEFLNRRAAKGEAQAAGQSQSNLWFVDPPLLDRLGPVLGRGGLWLNEDVPAGTVSDPYLFAGYDHRGLHLSHSGAAPLTVELEVDVAGDGAWQPLRSVTLAAGGSTWIGFEASERGEWVRLRPTGEASGLTAWFVYRNADRRLRQADGDFAALADGAEAAPVEALLRARGGELKTLAVSTPEAMYELDADLQLTRTGGPEAGQEQRGYVPIPPAILTIDAASVVYVDDAGQRWRFPRGAAELDATVGQGRLRIAREVVTERDLLQIHGSFYELPADNAGGVAKVRPIATHNRAITDFCSYRGLLVLSGLSPDARGPRVIRSDDGQMAVWVGAVDDLWRLGKPTGRGGPWRDTPVGAGEASDPYLMCGYDRKVLTLSHDSDRPVTLRVEVDAAAEGLWTTYREFVVAPGEQLRHEFPGAFGAAWLRVVSDTATNATAQLVYD